MNMSQISDLLPYFCHFSNRFRKNEITLQSIRTACALRQTDQSLYASVSKDSFWDNLFTRIGKEDLFLDERPKGNYFTLIKHQFKVLNQWVKNAPSLSHEVVNTSSIINHPLKNEPQLKVISLSSEIKIQTLLEHGLDEDLMIPTSNFTPFFTPESQKLYTCVASSKNFIVINKDDSTVHIYKNKEYLSTFPFKGLILQIEIRNDYLYIQGSDLNGYKLTILNLNSLNCTPIEVSIPLEINPNSRLKTYFGQTHLVFTSINHLSSTLMAASYEDLLHCSENKIWKNRTESGIIILFEESDRFICLNFNLKKTFSIAELICTNEDLTYQSIEEELSIIQSQSGIYHKIDCIQGRLFIAYSENDRNRICTYDLETKKLSRIDLTNGPGFHTILPIPYFISTTPLKVHFLTFPFINGVYDIQKISIFGFNYDT